MSLFSEAFSSFFTKAHSRHATRQSKSSRRTTRIETLEARTLFAGNPLSGVQSFDGTDNNLNHPEWGAASANLLRLAPAAYADGISTPAGASRASARAISNLLNGHEEGDVRSAQLLSAFTYAWGQFIDHDLDLTTAAVPSVPFKIAVPAGDPQFDPDGTGTKTIPLNRSKSDPLTGTNSQNPRQQINDITAYLDGSMIYGSDATRAAALRTFSGGHLKTSDGNLLPLNTNGLPNANDAHVEPDSALFLAGDVRANENVELSSIHTLFMREHNRLADLIGAKDPSLTDEQIFQKARRLVIGELQVITYKEFLPALLGDDVLKPYRGYNANVNPGISNEFSAAAFRLGHSMVGNDVEFIDNEGEEIRDPLDFSDAFFHPAIVHETGIDPILKYLASDLSEEIDLQVVDSLRNMLFGPPGSGGLDLASLNLQRGRDHGLSDYNSTRVALGLPRARSFADISSDPDVRQQLKAAYGTVDKIDLWAGGLAEDHIRGGNVGPTFSRIIADQFQRLRDGDRFWYERVLTGADLRLVQKTTLADVIKRNTGLTNLQDDVFHFRVELAGTVFADRNGNGRHDLGERGIRGRTIELLDEAGVVIATTVTNAHGRYRFTDLGLGSYTVREQPVTGQTQPPARTIHVTHGMVVLNLNFAEPGPGSLPIPYAYLRRMRINGVDVNLDCLGDDLSGADSQLPG